MNKKIINFKISKQNDVFAFFELANQSNDIKEKLFSSVSFKEEDMTEEIVALCVDELYEKEERLMKNEMEEIEKNWNDKQTFFMIQSKKIFKDINIFPNGVIAIPSVWPLYGRFFEKQLITFPYKKGADEAIFVIVHEYLHFLFYKYLYTKFKLKPEEMSSQSVWDFSEAINVVIQNQKTWIEVFKIKAKPYPQHVALHDNLLKDWNERVNMDDLVQKYIIEK
jgi:hypothetical protein